jgi:hypothetical protein
VRSTLRSGGEERQPPELRLIHGRYQRVSIHTSLCVLCFYPRHEPLGRPTDWLDRTLDLGSLSSNSFAFAFHWRSDNCGGMVRSMGANRDRQSICPSKLVFPPPSPHPSTVPIPILSHLGQAEAHAPCDHHPQGHIRPDSFTEPHLRLPVPYPDSNYSLPPRQRRPNAQ